jgi:hypothetical protein
MAGCDFMTRPFNPNADEGKDTSHWAILNKLQQQQSAVDPQQVVAATLPYGAATAERTVV